MDTYGLGTHLIDWVAMLILWVTGILILFRPSIERWQIQQSDTRRAASLLAAIRSGKISIE